MHNSIIVSSALFGSVYIFAKSLELLNNHPLENIKMPHKLIIINGITCVCSGSIFTCALLYSLKKLYNWNTLV